LLDTILQPIYSTHMYVSRKLFGFWFILT